MDRDLGAAPSVLFIGGGGYSLPAMLLDLAPMPAPSRSRSIP